MPEEVRAPDLRDGADPRARRGRLRGDGAVAGPAGARRAGGGAPDAGGPGLARDISSWAREAYGPAIYPRLGIYTIHDLEHGHFNDNYFTPAT